MLCGGYFAAKKMLRKVYCASCRGLEVITVTVEVEVTDGICFYLVGLADNAVKESQQRIGAALGRYGYRIPGKKIVINMVLFVVDGNYCDKIFTKKEKYYGTYI